MIAVSEKYRQQLANGNRNYLVKADITLNDNPTPSQRTVLHLTNEQIWDNGVVIENSISSDSSFDIGAAIIGSLTLVLNNINGIFDGYDFINAKVDLFMGVTGDTNGQGNQVYYRIGYYVVDDTQYNGSLITLDCLDNMTWFDVPFSNVTGVSYPITAGQLVTKICTAVGVTLYSSAFPNYNTQISAESGEWLTSNDVNCREVLQYVSQKCCCYCKINTAGQLVLTWYDKTQITGIVDYDGGTFNTTTTPYSDGDNLDGGNFLYSDAEAVTVTFDANCETESGYDKVTIYYEDNGVYYKRDFSGAFGGVSFYLPTTKFWLTFHADTSITKWGWRISSIVPEESGTVTGFSESSLPSESWTTITDTSDMPESEHPYDNGSSSAYYFNLELTEASVDGGSFTELANRAWLSQNYEMNVSVDDIVVTGCRVVSNSGEDDKKYDELYVDSTLEQTHERYVLVIENNPLIVKNEAATIANSIGATLAGLPIRAFSSRSLNDISYETGDMVTIVDFRGSIYYTWITSLAFTINNSENFSCGAQSIRQRSETRYSQSAKTIAEANQNASNMIDAYDSAVKQMNELAQSAIGYNKYQYDSGTGTITWLYNGSQRTGTDANPLFPKSTVVFKISGDGVFISNDGGTTYTQGYDANSGTAILSLIYAVGLNASWINTGTLTVGGTANTNGAIEVYDATGTTRYGKWSKDGVEINGGTLKTTATYVESGETIQRGVEIGDGLIKFIPPTGSSANASINMYTKMSSVNTGIATVSADVVEISHYSPSSASNKITVSSDKTDISGSALSIHPSVTNFATTIQVNGVTAYSGYVTTGTGYITVSKGIITDWTEW